MIPPDVTIIDYGVGNLLSVQRGLEHWGANVVVTTDPFQILDAKRVVLPGVGAFGNAMQALDQLGMVKAIREIARRKTPLLGICLGMQLMFEESEEFGITTGLGLIPGRVIPIPTQTIAGKRLKIPHIGWSELQPSCTSSGWRGTLLEDIQTGEAAYFVHSFMAVPVDPMNRYADCVYGDRRITAVMGRDQLTGCQFHPEKSGNVGLRILRRFLMS